MYPLSHSLGAIEPFRIDVPGSWEKICSVYEKAVAKFPESRSANTIQKKIAGIRNEVGVYHMDRGEVEMAHENFQEAVNGNLLRSNSLSLTVFKFACLWCQGLSRHTIT